MCDTFVAMHSSTAGGSVIFGKNSDREPNEAQVLEYQSAATHKSGSTVGCMYIAVPQVAQTYAVLLSRPFWMWGAEMGANEKGVVIGNEAVWTKMPYRKKDGLTGMDLLRLALERAGSALAAVEVIVQLLHDFGQGGSCGYEDKSMIYHNSFIIADAYEAWVLETAGDLWAASKVITYHSISNGLTIGVEIDKQHPDLIPYARKKGWLKKGEIFNFAVCYSDWFYTTFSGSRKRKQQSSCFIRDHIKAFDVSNAVTMLRSHHALAYRPDKSLISDSICAHAGIPLTRHSTQTTGSMVARLKKDLSTFWFTGTSAPCTGIFKPIWFGEAVLPNLGTKPIGLYDPKSVWWRHELLHRSVLRNYQSRLTAYKNDRDLLESTFLTLADEVEERERFALTEEAFRRSEQNLELWLEKVRDVPAAPAPAFIYNRYWKRQNRKAGIEVV